MSPVLLAMAFSLAISCLLLFATWVYARSINNAGIVDVIWSFGFSVLAIFNFFFGTGWLPRKALIAAMTIVWSVRLTAYLFGRFRRWYPQEDVRYAEFRKSYGARADVMFFWIFQLQAVILGLLAAPLALASNGNAGAFSVLELVGVAIWLVGLLGESLADRQLSVFVSNPDNRGTTCALGLWRYSRHPNYFFEWVIWIGFFVFALASPFGIWAIYCPLLMLHLLLNVTGVKLAELHSLQSRGDEYRRYQQSTSAFVPWFRKD